MKNIAYLFKMFSTFLFLVVFSIAFLNISSFVNKAVAAGPFSATYQQGVSGYGGGEDNELDGLSATTVRASGGRTYPDRVGVEYCGSACSKVLLRFKNLALPADAVISNVQLQLKEFNHQGGINNIYVYKVSRSDWDTNNASWNNYKASTPWTSPGGDAGSSLATLAAPGAGNWLTIDLGTNFTAQELEQNGILISTDIPGYNLVWFYSNEYSSTTDRPKLAVTYTSASGPAGPVISNVGSSNITSNSATITWTTDISADSNVNYGTTTGYGSNSSDTNLLTSHSINLSGLIASTTYHYQVQSIANGVTSSSTDVTFATSAASSFDITPPSTPTNLSATAVSANQINLSWTASTDNVGVTGYKIFRNGNQVGTSATTSYSDTGLTASTTYSYTVSAYDAASNNSSQSTSSNGTTQAQGAPDTTPPTVFLTAPSSGATVSGSTTVSATASDNIGVAGVQFKLDGSNLSSEDTSSPYSITWDTTATTNASHTLTATARDAAGNTTTSSSVSVTVGNTPPPPTGGSAPQILPSYITAAQSMVAQNTPQWQAFKNNLDQNLSTLANIMKNGPYQASELEWISQYALGYQLLKNSDPVTAAKYADKTIGLMKLGIRDQQRSGEGSRQFLAQGNGSTKVFTIPNADAIASSFSAYIGSSPQNSSPVSATLSGTTATFNTAPGSGQNIYVEYIYGTHATDFSTLAYQMTESGGGGLSSILIDTTYTSRYLGKHVAMGYDWLNDYAGFSTALRTEVASMLVQWSDYVRDNGYYKNSIVSNYGAGGYVSRMLTAVALNGRDATNGTRLKNEMLAYYQANVVPILSNTTNSLYGGFWVEGWNYGQLATRNILIAGLAAKEIGWTNNVAESNWAGQVIESLIHEQPTQSTIFDGGDGYAWPAPFPSKDLSYLLSASTSNTSDKSYANQIIQQYSGSQKNDYQDILFRDVNAATANWTSTLPLSYLSSGSGLLNSRADWSYQSTWITFLLGNILSADHQMYAPGHFQIQRGADNLLIDAPSVGGLQDSHTKSQFSNTIIIDDNGDGAQNYRWNMGFWYGSPGVIMNNYETTNSYVYSGGDYRAAYSLAGADGAGGPATKLTRQMVYVRPDYIIIHDRVGTTKNTYSKQLRLHFLNAPTVSGNSFTETAGSSKLFGQTFSSVPLTTTVSSVTVGNATIRELITQNSSPTLNVQYVTALQVAPSSTSSMNTTTSITSGGGLMEGTQIGNQVVMFGTNGALTSSSGPVTYAITGTTVSHLLVDLVPNSTYTVTANGTSNGVYTASAQGTIFYTTTGSGSQNISVSLGGTPPSDSTPPTVSITAPSSGSTVSGSTTVSATASDNIGVAGVQFKLDGSNLSSEDTSSPYSITWDTTATTNASHTLTATARDAAGNTTTSSSVSVTVNNSTPPPPSDSIPPSTPTGLSATATSSSQINLSWTASTDNVGVTGYKIFRAGTQVATSTTTNYSDTGLAASTAYTYTVSAYDAASNNSPQSTSASATTQAPPDTTSPVISNVGSSSVTTTSATITWITNENSDTQIDYGPTTAYGLSTALNSSLVTSHSQNLSSLSSSTLYHYRVRSKDAAGNLATSLDFTFTTLSIPDTTPPTASLSAPSSGSTIVGTTTVSATASDNIGVAGVQFKLDGSNLSSEDVTSPFSVQWNTSSSTNGSHTLTATARDAAGNTTTSSTVTVTVNNPVPDLQAPTISITAPSSGATVSDSITVSATASDNVGVAGVQFKLDGQNLGVEDATSPYSFSWDTTTIANGSHTLTATARDAAGNTTTSSTITVTLNNMAPVINQPPVVDAGLNQSINLPSTANLSGTATDDGLPLGSILTKTWSVASGPAAVSFGNAGALATTASFSQPGTYVITLTASDGILSATSNTTITVNLINTTPTATLSVSPKTITQGQTATLVYSSSGATSASIDQNIGSVSINGSMTVFPTQTTTYTFTALNGPAGTNVTSQATVVVTPPTSTSTSSGGSTGDTQGGFLAPTAKLSADHTMVTPGATVTLTYTTSGVNSVTITPDIGAVGGSGSQTITPTKTTTYVLTATNVYGTSVTSQVTITVGNSTSTSDITTTQPITPATCTATPDVTALTSELLGIQQTIAAWGTQKPIASQLQDVLQRIQVLSSKLTPCQTTTPSTSTSQTPGQPYVFARYLGLTDTGDDVLALQKLLIRLGYLRSTATTGYYGLATQAAVRAYQTSHGLTPTGQVGPRTKVAINTGN